MGSYRDNRGEALNKNKRAYVQCLRYPGEPTGYMAWHEWAEKKSKTHKQFKCAVCGLWHIWRRKP